MLEEAEDRAARAVVEGRQMRAGGEVIIRLPKPYNDNGPNTGKPLDIIAVTSDGGSTSYNELPPQATELNDLIEHKGMSFALGNIFKACYRFGEKDAASRLYDLNKIIYFAERLKALELRKVA